MGGAQDTSAGVTVLGAGTMGAGIGQLAAMGGHAVVIHDVDSEVMAGARERIDLSIARLVKSGKLTPGEAGLILPRISWSLDLEQAARGAQIVVEAVPERRDLKQEVLRRAAAVASTQAVVGTNTSQLSITSLGSGLGNASARLVGMHFFNPPVIMRLVELIRGLDTSESTLAAARDFAVSLGKIVVVCQKDSPGFLTSRISAIMRLECLRMLEEGLATAADIDTAAKLAFNLPMGPLELGDFNGLDTFLHAAEGLQQAHGERFRPPSQLRNMVAAGRLGRKSGRGFYRYDGAGNRLEQE